jgi:hypothetical protein
LRESSGMPFESRLSLGRPFAIRDRQRVSAGASPARAALDIPAAAISLESDGTNIHGVVGASLRRGNVVKGSNLLRRVILVVDDEPLIVLNLKTVLEAARAKVICANTRDAGKVVERPDISAAVLDAWLKLRNLAFLFYSLPLRYLPDRGGLRRSHCGVVRIRMVGARMLGPALGCGNVRIRGASADTCSSGRGRRCWKFTTGK